MSDLLRDGRLRATRKDVVDFTSSLKDDRIILKHILNINKAHIIMLTEQGIIN
jgi:argininosuccinate lyase